MVGIKYNISASLASQLYAAVVAIVMLPVYLKYMGAEAYGLVGFFTMAQALFQLLDLGLSPMVMRYVARYRGGVVSRNELSRVLRTVVTCACSIALLGAIVGISLSTVIAERWFRATKLDGDEISYCISLMAVAIAFRFVSSLVRSAVSGFEALVTLGGVTILITTLRFICVLPAMWHWGARPGVFFAYQVVVSTLELAILSLVFARLMRSGPDNVSATNDRSLLQELRFAFTASLTGGIWILSTQVDKVLLSSMLTLDHFGFYTLCASLANGVLLLSSPIGMAILPRLIRLQSEGRREEVYGLYLRGSQLAIVVTTPVIVLLTLFSGEFLWIWTADKELARLVGPTLLMYSAGTAFLIAGSFPYLLQVSQGTLRLHVMGSLAFVAVLVALVYGLTPSLGMRGAALAWLACNVIMFLIWTPVVHFFFLPGPHWRWVGENVARIWIPTLAAGAVCQWILQPFTSRLLSAVQLAVVLGIMQVIAVLSSGEGARLIRRYISPCIARLR